MKSKTTLTLVVLILVFSFGTHAGQAKDDDFGSVVKMIEKYYNVKHQGIPFLARAGLKVFSAAAKVKGGDAKRFAELGSVKVALFEDQDFDGDPIKFRELLNDTLKQNWMPFVQVLSSTEGEQVYIYLREKGDKFNCLIVTLEPREGTVVQATLSSKNLAKLLLDPEKAGQTLSQEATIFDND